MYSTSPSVSMPQTTRAVTECVWCPRRVSHFPRETLRRFRRFSGKGTRVPAGRTDRPWHRRPLCFRSAEGALFERVPDAVGSAGRLPDGRAGLGRDEGQRQRAHVLAGGRGPRVPAQAGRVQGQAAGPAAWRQAPQVVQAAGGSGRQQGGTEKLAEGAEDHDERAAVQVCVLSIYNYNSKTTDIEWNARRTRGKTR